MSKNNRDIRIGEERLNNQGYLMRIVEYNNANDMIVEFQDKYKTRVRAAYNNFIKGKVRYQKNRLGEENYNNEDCLMKIIEYNDSKNIIVEFQDKNKARVHTTYNCFLHGEVRNPLIHFDEENLNKQGCLMKIVEYNKAKDIIVEFQDDYRAKVHSQYDKFIKGQIKNPYYPSVCGVGMIGNRYPVSKDYKDTKEYALWCRMIRRCFDVKNKRKNPSYQNVTCCEEWLLFENFYEWLRSQENFDKWYDGDMWAIDKDILIKNNKIYSPETCCLVPINVNSLFTKSNATRGSLPIGVERMKNKFRSTCSNPFTKKTEHSCLYSTINEAFRAYKNQKEEIIKQIAETEYSKGNITKQCYEAMLRYEVEIDD